MSWQRQTVGGYILIETAVAVVVLSIGALTVHRTIQEAIRTRGQAQDYTRVRFLLKQVVADIEMQPELVEHSDQGRFEGEHARFSWDYEVRRVDVPLPEGPLVPPAAGTVGLEGEPFAYPEGQEYLAHVRATVAWSRSGREYSESYETLLGPDRLWQAPKGVTGL